MATYPTLPTAYGSDFKPINDIEIDRAADGTAYVRSFFSASRGSASVKHPRLTAADKATLDAFYATNRLLEFDYVSPADGVSRSCVFKGAPAYTVRPGARYDASVEIEQV
jgi:hypothetical protein